MPSARQHRKQLEEILGTRIGWFGQIRLDFSFDGLQEAREQLSRIKYLKARLRELKRDINEDCRAIRSRSKAERAMVGKTLLSVLGGAAIGRRAMGSLNALKREELRLKQSKAIAPYEGHKRTIDAILIELDRAKSRIELSRALEASKQTSPETALTY